MKVFSHILRDSISFLWEYLDAQVENKCKRLSLNRKESEQSEIFGIERKSPTIFQKKN